MEGRKALTRLPPSDAANLRISLPEQKGFSLWVQRDKYRAGHGETSAFFGPAEAG
jgi:hypothetical protein